MEKFVIIVEFNFHQLENRLIMNIVQDAFINFVVQNVTKNYKMIT